MHGLFKARVEANIKARFGKIWTAGPMRFRETNKGADLGVSALVTIAILA